MRWTWICAAAALALGSGCGGDDDETDTPDVNTSVVRGKLELATFAAPPTGVLAIDEAGARTNTGIAPDGAFELVLPKDHVYEVVVVSGAGETPIVYPRVPTPRLDKTFRLSSGNAVVALGTIRFFAKAPDTALPAIEPTAIECAPGIALEPPDDDGDDDPPALGEKDADRAQPFAVPEKNAPNDVRGCED